jgi:hypothetical protein
MPSDLKTVLWWSLGALVFLAVLLAMTFALPGLNKAAVTGKKGQTLTAAEFFTAEQLAVMSAKSYDPRSPPDAVKGSKTKFVLTKDQKQLLFDAGYDGCVTNDGFADRDSPMGCFCENIPIARAVFDKKLTIMQPWNAWSAVFGFTPFGLLILVLLIVQASGNRPPQSNLMVDNYFYSIFYAFLAIFLGPASAMFHLALRAYGGWLDSFSIHLLFGFTLVYNIVRYWMKGGGWESNTFLGLSAQRWLFLVFFVVSTVIVEIICLPGVMPGMRFWFDLIIGGVALVIQTIVFLSQRFGRVANVTPDGSTQAVASGVPPGGGWYFVAAGITFGVAVLIWSLSWSALPLCAPEGFQGHAVWHVLSGLGAFFLFLYFRNEGAPQSVTVSS